MSNRVELTGTLVDAPQMRRSPAGIPITRALLEHESRQTEAGSDRYIRFRVGLRAAGSPLAESLESVAAGASLNVTGCLLRARQRNAETDPIIVSVSHIERLAEPKVED